MAVAFKGNIQRTSEYRAFPEDIVVKAQLNGRHDLPDIEWLIADILDKGQLQAVVVRKDGDRMMLVAGFSRWRAISEINKRKLAPVKMQLRCTYTQCTEQEGFIACIAENRQRNATTELDDAHNIKRLMGVYAMTEEQVAQVYFPGAKESDELKDAAKWVKKRAKLIGLTKEAAQAVKDGRIKVSAAEAIAKLSEEQQRDAVKGEGKIKGSTIRQASGKQAAPSPAKAMKEAIKSVIVSGKFPGIGGKECEASDDLVEFLAGLIGEGKK